MGQGSAGVRFLFRVLNAVRFRINNVINSLVRGFSLQIGKNIVACQAHPALVKRAGVHTVFISLLVN